MTPAASLSARVLAALAVGAIALIPHPALADGCGQDSTASPALARSTTSSGLALRAVLDAVTIAGQMDRNPNVFMADPFDEGPETVVRGGICTRQLAGLCYRMVSTKDASVIVFNRAADAEDYAGCGDDSATRFGRTIVSYGSPPRVVLSRQAPYDRAVQTFRREHPEARNDVDRVVRYLTRQGLLMRDPQIEDSRGERLGRASTIPGALSMATTRTADVIVFTGRAAAQTYLENADDTGYRYGRVVLSYGAPARVIPSGREVYQRVLRRVLG